MIRPASSGELTLRVAASGSMSLKQSGQVFLHCVSHLRAEALLSVFDVFVCVCSCLLLFVCCVMFVCLLLFVELYCLCMLFFLYIHLRAQAAQPSVVQSGIAITKSYRIVLQVASPLGRATRPRRTSPACATLLDLCVSSLRRGHANLLCIAPILTDDSRTESFGRMEAM